MGSVVPSTGLKEGEKVLWSGKPRLVGFLGSIIFSIILILLMIIPFIGWITAIIGVIILVLIVLRVNATTYLVTNMRVLREYRLIGRNMQETTLDHITDIVFHQGLFGRLFNFGIVHIHTAGTGFIGIHFQAVGDPMTVRGTIINAKDSYRQVERFKESPVVQRETITKEVVMVQCEYCKSLMPQTSTFCPNCGAKRKI